MTFVRPLPETRTVVLIGMRGSGKTTVGQMLAEMLGRRFIDLDDLVAGEFPESSVIEIWRVHGESAWREAEVRQLDKVLGSAPDRGLVLALGGGVPATQAARHLIHQARRSGAIEVVYLSADAACLVSRLKAEAGDRPSLTGADVAKEIAAILSTREAAYREVADMIVAADRPPEMIAIDIIDPPGPGDD